MSELKRLQAGVCGDRFWEVAKGILMRQGLSQGDAATLLDRNKSWVSYMTNPDRNPTESSMLAFVEPLGFRLYIVAVPHDA